MIDTSDAALLVQAGRLAGAKRRVEAIVSFTGLVGASKATLYREAEACDAAAATLRAIVAERQAGVQVKPLVWAAFADIDASPQRGKHGDNLAVALCSYFDRHNECPDGDEDGAELDDYDCWKVWVSENAEAVLRRIATKANDLMEARIRATLKGPNDDQ
jgi:hypothetical protein